MNKRYMRRGLIVVAVLAILFWFKWKSATPEVVEVAPEKTPFIIQTSSVKELRSTSDIVKYSKLVGAQEITISSKVSWKIISLPLLAGEKVRKNEPIVQLEDSNASATYQQQRAKVQLASARSAYNLTVTQINQSITDASTALQQAKTQYAAISQKNWSTAALQVGQLSAQVDKAQLDYQTLLTSNQQTVQNFISTAKNIAKEIELLYQDITLTADQILGVSDLHKQSNDYFENSLGAQNSSTRRDAQSELRALLNEEEMFNDTGLQYTSTTLVTNLQILKQNLQLLSPLLDKMETMFQYTHSTSSISQAQIDGYMWLIDGFQAQLQGQATAITAQINGMESFLATYKNNETSAQQQVQIIQQQGKITESTLGDNATLARLQTERAQQAYNNVLEIKNQSLATAQNGVDQAQIALNEATDLLERFEVTSPIDGTIGELFVDEWQEVNIWTPLATISNNGAQKIEISLTQEEREFLDIGQEVVVHNHGNDITGILTSVSKQAGGNFTYKAIIELTEDIDLLWDLVSVDIQVSTKLPLIPLNVVTILNSNEWLINTRENGAIKPLRVMLGKVRWESVEIKTQLEDNLVVILSDINNYNPTINTLKVK